MSDRKQYPVWITAPKMLGGDSLTINVGDLEIPWAPDPKHPSMDLALKYGTRFQVSFVRDSNNFDLLALVAGPFNGRVEYMGGVIWGAHLLSVG